MIMEKAKKAKKSQLQHWISVNEIINKFLLARDKFMSEIHLRQSRVTYSACGPFTKNKKKC